MLRVLLGVLITTAVASAVPAADEPRAENQTTIQVRSDALLKEFSDASRRGYEAEHKAKTDEERSKIPRPDGGAYAERLMAMAREHPDDPGAAAALSNAILIDPFGRSFPEAVKRLAEKHVKSPRIKEALQSISFAGTLPEVEPLLRAVLKDNPDAAARGEAALALVKYLTRMAKETNYLAANPEAYQRVIASSGQEAADRIKNRDSKAMLKEAETLLESVVEEHANVPYDEKQSLGERAATILHEMRELVVGKPAPEIEGKDVDGKPMKLSEHRGKVVVLSWWATWCSPCMALVPHERELVRRMEGKPFVLLGVNGDEDRGRLEHQMKANGVSWRSWYDGGPDGPISTRWNVTGWPTVYVLDRDGVIRYKGSLDVRSLDEAVDKLLPES
ncbi:MAG: TlpA disulfide reductase family protein [Paludisphaera borealis]|uniref:TlpA family protein disulfide reductase n=1 Tax=Paludisphaera borealis TaxID=1387353 RepID=UPI002849CC53|nr:TlpA disulfide reductase family protein [Paludisphaera borealis]MDR3622139.1 TlpA disulfide reductase family protein [Paludisphaera borealis]